MSKKEDLHPEILEGIEEAKKRIASRKNLDVGDEEKDSDVYAITLATFGGNMEACEDFFTRAHHKLGHVTPQKHILDGREEDVIAILTGKV